MTDTHETVQQPPQRKLTKRQMTEEGLIALTGDRARGVTNAFSSASA